MRAYLDCIEVSYMWISLLFVLWSMESFEPELVNRPTFSFLPLFRFLADITYVPQSPYSTYSTLCTLFMLAYTQLERRLDRSHCFTLVLKRH